MTLTLATRGSALALWQARETRTALSAAHPDCGVELLTVKSSGDLDQLTDLARFGRIGIFTVEVDRALLDGRAQVGVHSLKDMTTTLQDGVVLGAVLPRGPVEDVLVSPSGATLDELPTAGRIATGSTRRKAMLLRARPDIEVGGIRGNVETRLTKLDAGEADALLMARAGLVRLGLGERVTEVLDTERFLPAVGQGIVGLTCRADDAQTRERLALVCHMPSWFAALAERALLRELEGGCNAPIGAHAVVDGDHLVLTARVLSLDGSECIEGSRQGPCAEAQALGVALAEQLLAAGAGALVEAARG